MNLDSYTIYLALSVSTFVQIGVLFLQSRKAPGERGIAVIAGAYCVIAAGLFISVGLRGVYSPSLLGVSTAVMVHLGVIGLNVGAMRLLKRPVRKFLLGSVFFIFLLGQVAFLITDRIVFNQASNMFGLAVYLGLVGYDVLGGKERIREASVWIIVILFCVPALLCALRFFLLLFVGSDGTVAKPGPLFALLPLVALIFMLLLSFSVITLVNERSTAALQRTRDELRAARDQEHAALLESQRDNEAKTRFLATMSHELRTPLHGILGMVRHVMEAMQDKEQLKWLQRVVGAGEHLLNIINDVLDFAKMDSGNAAIRHEPLDIARLVRDVYEIAIAGANQKGLNLMVEGEHKHPLWVLGDTSRIRQILINLVGNAVKFTEQGTVTIHLHPEPEQIVILVSDTGPGIRAADRELVFKPFYQIDETSTRRHGGTGLGLPLSRDLARRLGGDLHLESEVGVGSIFEFSFPRKDAASPAPESPAGPGPEQLRGRVLLAEDNEDAARLALLMLDKIGLDAVRAVNGENAVQMFQAEAPDIILMDNHMPAMDGLEATRRIRALEGELGRRPVPIIGITADAFENDRKSCLNAGMNEHLAKPFRKEQLWEALARHLPPGLN